MAQRTMAQAHLVGRWASRTHGQEPPPLYRGAYRADARALTGGTHGDVVYEKAVPSGCVYELIRPPSWRGSLSWDNKANHRFCWENLVSVLQYLDHEDGGVFAEVLIITEYLALPKLKPEVESVRFTTRTSKISKG